MQQRTQGQRWRGSLYGFLLWLGVFWYAVHYVHSAWGMVTLGGVYGSGFWLLIQTGRYVCGKTAAPAQRIRRVIIEEIVP
jgi:hypothetical protein